MRLKLDAVERMMQERPAATSLEEVLDVFEVFASGTLNARGHAQAERLLGDLRIVSGHIDFEFVAAGDLRGQWIAATATYQDSLTAARDSTSELSDPVRVRP